MLFDSGLIISRGRLEVIGQFESSGHYLVIDQASERVGVLKILNNANAQVYDYLLHHPHGNICAVYDYWLEDGKTFVIEEYISGWTLEEMLMKEGFSEEKAVDILCEICDGLIFLHDAKPSIIHKDLKLANVMVDASGNVKIIDFDISRIYRAGADQDTYPYGTKPYASPEHYGFGQTNEKSDQYAIGQMMKRMGLEYGRFANIIRKTTQVDPEKRYKNVTELKRDLIGDHVKIFPPPGFRTRTMWKEVVAIVGYLLILFITFNLQSKNTAGIYEVWCNRLTAFFVMLTEVDLFTKWTPLFRQIPLLKDSRAVVRVLSHIFLGAIVFIIWVLFEAMVLHFLQEII